MAQVTQIKLSIQFRHGNTARSRQSYAQPSLPPPSSAARHPCPCAPSAQDRPPTTALRQRTTSCDAKNLEAAQRSAGNLHRQGSSQVRFAERDMNHISGDFFFAIAEHANNLIEQRVIAMRMSAWGA